MPYSIVTYGFLDDSPYKIPTYGFYSAQDLSLLPPAIDIELTTSIQRTMILVCRATTQIELQVAT
jgi:hypothetical protein